MDKDNFLQEAVDFFKKEPGLKRLFQQFIKNYKRLGRLGGTAQLTKLTKQEKEALSGLLGKDYTKQSSATISVQSFQKALEQTRFADIDLKDLLFGYSGAEILTKTEEKQEYETAKSNFFAELINNYSDPYCQQWIKHIESKGKGTRGIHLAYDQDRVLLKTQLSNVLNALSKLPGRGDEQFEYYRLPVFANLITKDPHAFDLNTQQGRFLISALAFLRHKEDDYVSSNSPSVEEITELLSYFGLVRDDMLNFVSCTGIVAFKKGEENPIEWWQKSWEEGVALNVPLREIVKGNKFYPANNKNVVFVVENSGVFSEILERFQSELLPPLICTNGQFKLAALLLLDRLVSSGVKIYYSGDFDPEGLQMAQRLKARYPDNVKLWHYTEDDYNNCRSEVVMAPMRLKKLNNIDLPQLSGIKNLMQQNKKAGYQEKLINKLVADIEKIV